MLLTALALLVTFFLARNSISDKGRNLTCPCWELFQCFCAWHSRQSLQIAARCRQTGSLTFTHPLLGMLGLLLHFPVWIPFIATLHRIELASWPWTICSTHNSLQFLPVHPLCLPERWRILGLPLSSSSHWPSTRFLLSTRLPLVHPHLGLQSKCFYHCFRCIVLLSK